jgi:hypothetical protein
MLALRLLAIAALFATSGCAAMFGKKDQPVTFNSDPQGAKVYIGGKYIGQTPVTVKLPIRSKYEVTYLKEKLSVREFSIKPTNFSPHTANRVWCMLDFVPGSLMLNIPMIVDIYTGACRGFDSTYIKIMRGDVPLISEDKNAWAYNDNNIAK